MGIDDTDVRDCPWCEDWAVKLAAAEERIAELERDNEKLRDECAELRADLDYHMGERDRLKEAAELMADLGQIHNTPAAKLAWVRGK